MVGSKSSNFLIKEISSSSEYLATIMKLADANSTTLGFLPYGAFHRLADKGFILAYIVPNIGCLGYLLYEIRGQDIVKLRHLCVDEQWRDRGITKELLKYLRAKTKHFQGIRLSCRRDYNLQGMWTSLGFVALDERPGRSKDGSILTEWWLDYGHPNLLTTLTQQATESRICAAIDANIFYDIADDETVDDDSKESKALMSDWLETEIELCLTDEIRNEIDRNKDSQRRRELRNKASKFMFLPCKQDAFEQACQSLRQFFPETLTQSDASDLRQLARVIGSDVKTQFFITRDRRLFEEIEEDIYKKFNLLILHPIDFILRLDELRRETEYQPIRLSGTELKQRRVQSGECNSLIDLFLDCPKGENKINFQRKIRQILSDLNRFECFTVGREEEIPIALIIYDRGKKHELEVPIFRFKDTQITPTILRHSIFECFSTAAREGKHFTRITEPNLAPQAIFALQEDKFVETSEGWLKANLEITDSSSNISAQLSELCQAQGEEYRSFRMIADALSNQELIKNTSFASEIERILYPVKISDSEIPSFVIPIQSWYAKDLFDKELAEEILWGAKEDIALRREVVYYRSRQASGGLEAPGRILWYVSKTGDHNSSSILGAIRACSQLDEITIGKPIDLYKRFRRLGIYDFKSVLRTAREDFDREIMAIKFSNTELFSKPIKLREVEQILGRKISVRAPYKLTCQDFAMLYNKRK